MRRFTGFLLTLIAGVAAVGLYQRLERQTSRAPDMETSGVALADPIGESRRNAIVRAAEVVGPSVVSITAVESRVVSTMPPEFNQLFGQFFGYLPGRTYEQEVPKFGSGFIIDDRGHVLTNSHVVAGAEEIQVTLPDGRQFKGTLLGADAGYDLAVVKIEGPGLPAARFGSSEDLLVGEWAIAVGNPFGYLLGDAHPTVTVGVISATNRDIKTDVREGGVYKNMIQTDAAINPGNSGGPLVNSNGEVIGVNTFIFTQGGGSLGIGFAIPIATAVSVAREIIDFGRVRGVWIGMTVVDVSPFLARELKIADTRGALVYSLERGSPAHRSGIQAGDIIRKIGPHVIEDKRDASREIFGARAGDTVVFTVERDGNMKEIPVQLESMPDHF